MDCVLPALEGYDESSVPIQTILNGVPSREIKIVTEEDYRFFADILFASDRSLVPKGVVEVLL